jgi:hypothetical protein
MCRSSSSRSALTHPSAGPPATICDWYRQGVPDTRIRPFYGERVWEEIIAEAQPDVLMVATPDDLHYPPIIGALSHGLDVISEKPLCLSLEQADEIICRCRDRPVASLPVTCTSATTR